MERFYFFNTIVGNGKRFLAYEIINRLEIERNGILLNHLESGLTARGKEERAIAQSVKRFF